MTKYFNWQQELLKGLPVKQFGRSYDEKFKKAAKAAGVKDVTGFRNFLDNTSRETPKRVTKNEGYSAEYWDEYSQQLHPSPKTTVKAESRSKMEDKKPKTGLLNDILTPLKRYGEGVKNVFDGDPNTTFTDAFKNAVNDAKSTDRSKVTKELTRGLTRTANSALLGALDETYKKTHDGESAVQFQSRKGVGKAADFAYDALGLFAPGAAAYKGAKALKLGAKAGTKGIAKAGQLAKEGAAAGALFGAGQVGVREAINGKDYSAKENARDIALNTLLGGVADPLLVGGNQLLKGASEKAIKKLLPNSKDLGKRLGETYMTGEKSDLPTSKPIHGSLQDRLRALSPNRKLPDFSNAKPVIDNPNENIIAKHYGIDVPAKPRDLVEEAPREYWQKRYEDFAKYVHQNYDTNKITKEGLDELWTHFAKPDEPVNLEQLAELAYKDYKPTKVIDTNEVWSKFGNRKPVSNNALKKMGISRLQEPKGNQPDLLRSLRVSPIKNEVASAAEKITPQVENGGVLKRISEESEPILNEAQSNLDEEIKKIKDIGPFRTGTKNIYQIAERLPEKQKSLIVESLDKAKQSHVNMQEALTDDLFNTVVKDFGIKKGSKESALVQDYGEKKLVNRYLKKQGIDPKSLSPEELDAINLRQLKKVHPKNWEKIVQADEYFRKNYDDLINKVNEVRSKIYPNNPEKLVPKRNNYYHHFNELDGFEGIKNLFETPSNIDPHLEGLSPFTKPNTKFAGFMQKRLNGNYKSDAVGGFLKYLQAASHSINLDPVIPVLRKTANELADATEQTRNANNIIKALNNHANDLAGKTNPYDRLLQELIGRGTRYKLLTKANSQVKSNMVIGNLSSALGQIGNVPLGIAKAKQYAPQGLADTLIQASKQLLTKTKNIDSPIAKSNFIKERYSDRFYKRFDQKLLQQPKKLALWLMETADKAGTNFIWNSMYRKGLAKKVSDPIKYADSETRHIVAGRGVGEVPLLQKSKTMQILAPFTLEVGNQWTVLSKMAKGKDVSGLMTFLAASYGLNKAMEHIRGSGVTLDPVGAFAEGYEKGEGNTSDKLKHAIASLTGEVVGNIPGGNLLTNQVDTNKKLPFTDIKYKDLFGERSPNRFGTGVTLSKALQDPLYALSPFGASQFRKTTQGVDAIRNKAVYKGDNGTIPFKGPKKELSYPIDTNPLKNLQITLMGPSSTSDAKDYYDNKRVPLTEIQTKAYKQMEPYGLNEDLYNILRVVKTKPYDKGKITKIEKDDKLSKEEKVAKLMELIQTLRKK
ncbi:hypothetical protein [Heyndrickxia camelliae]|uniref:Uncharacterized protein n=1 Tax=Heyndrickxia camelliae TaxID=1707093 RepID=A0A2N3LN51_9BACI|nr:hypothetical protein [Heyndrickxia camelliae]PKR86092.1 hypothetical protein CWO92_06895 [Heyndrickxia camelliae]